MQSFCWGKRVESPGPCGYFLLDFTACFVSMEELGNIHYSPSSFPLFSIHTMKLHLNLSLRKALLAAMAVVASLSVTTEAGVVDSRYEQQYYLDFSYNKGIFAAGASDVLVKYLDGTSVANPVIPLMPNLDSYGLKGQNTMFGFTPIGGAGLVAPQYVMSASHCGETDVFFLTENEDYSTKYTSSGYHSSGSNWNTDWSIQRLNKIVTEVAYTPYASNAFMESLEPGDWLYRLGHGTFLNTDGELIDTDFNALGGLVNISSIKKIDANTWQIMTYLRENDTQGDTRPPLEIGAYSGDSGSPVYAWDEANKCFVQVAFASASTLGTGFGNDLWARYNAVETDKFIDSCTVKADMFSGGEKILWGAQDASTGKGTLTQGGVSVEYTGAGSNNPSSGQLGLTFSTSDTANIQKIELQNSVNMGAGAMTFDNGKWEISEKSSEFTFNSAGFVVNGDAELTLKLTGTSSEEWRKVGKGTMTIAGEGNNDVVLRVGGGTTVYNPAYDADNKLIGWTLGNEGETRLNRVGGYAASSVRLEAGVAIIVLMGNEKDASGQFKTKEVAGDTFTFGNAGGLLNLNGHDLTWGVINQDGSGTGARIGNFTPKGESAPALSTFTYTGTGTFAGCFMDEGKDSTAKLAVKYNNAGGEWTLTGNNTNVGGYTVEAGTMILEGSNTPHVGMVDEHDWAYASMEGSNVTINNGAKFQLSHHAVMSGDISVDAGGTFEINQTVNAASESISGRGRQDMAALGITSLKGNVYLDGGASMVVNTESPVVTTMEGNVVNNLGNDATNPQFATFTKSGSGLFVLDGQLQVPRGTIEAGGLVVKDANFVSPYTRWAIQEKGFLAIEGLNNETALACVALGSNGVLALTSDQATALDMSLQENLIIGAWGDKAINYGTSTATLGTVYDAESGRNVWRLGGGAGILNVNFLLSGDADLLIGNEWSSGTVNLTNSANTFAGNIFIQGVGNKLTYEEGALGNAKVSMSYGNALGLYQASQLGILSADSSGVLALASSMDLDLSSRNGQVLSIGAIGDLTYTGTVTAADDTYRFGGLGNLTLDTDLKAATASRMELDGQGMKGSSVTFARENAYDGAIVAGGSLQQDNEQGDISIHAGHEKALASASSISLQKGANLYTDGQNLAVNNLSMGAGAALINNGTTASSVTLNVGKDVVTSFADGVLNSSAGSAQINLVKTGEGTLQMATNANWTGSMTISEGVVKGSISKSSDGYYSSTGGIGADGNTIYVEQGGTLSITGVTATGRALAGTEIMQTILGTGTIEFSTGGSAFFSTQSQSFEGTIRLTGNTRIYVGEKLDFDGSGIGKTSKNAVNNATIEVTDGSQVRITSGLFKQTTNRVVVDTDFVLNGDGFDGATGNTDISRIDGLKGGALSIDCNAVVNGDITLASAATISSWSNGLGSNGGKTQDGYGIKGHLGGTIRGQISGEGKTLTFGGNEGMTITADAANTYGNLVIANGNGNNDDKFALRLDGGKAVSQTSTALGKGNVMLNDKLILRLAGTGTANQSDVVYTYANNIAAGNNSSIQSYNITNKLTGTVSMAEGADKTLNLATAGGGVLHLAGGVSGSGSLNIAEASKVILGAGASTTFGGNIVAGAGVDLALESASALAARTTITGADLLTLHLKGTEDYTLGGITGSALTLHFDFTQSSSDYATLNSSVSADSTIIAIDLNMFSDITEGNYTLISGALSNQNYTLADNLDGRLGLTISGDTLTLNVGAEGRLYWAADSASQVWNTSDANWKTGNKGDAKAYYGTVEVMLTSSGLSSAGTREAITVADALSVGKVNVSSLYEINGSGALNGTLLSIGAGGDLQLGVNASFSNGVLVNDGTLTVQGKTLTANVTAENGAEVNLNDATLTGNMTLGSSAAVNMDAARITGTVSSAISSPVVLKDAALSGTFSADVTASVLMADNMVLSAGSFEVVSQMQAGSITVDGGSFSIKGASEIENLAVSSGQSAKLYNADKTVGNNKKIGTLALADSASLVIENTTAGTSASGAIDTLQLAGTATIKEVRDSGYLTIGSLSLADGITTGTLQLNKANTNGGAAYTSVIKFGSATAPAGNFAGDIVMSNTKPSGSSGNHSLFVTLAGKEIFSNAVVKMQTQECSGGYLGMGIMADGAIIGGLESSASLGARALLFSGESQQNCGWNTGDQESHKLQNGGTVRTLVIDTDAGADYAFNGRVFNNLNIVKKGEGTQAFNGVSTGYNSAYNFNGAIELQEGTLIFGKDAISMLTNASSVTISGGTLDISSYDFNAANAGLELKNFTFSENAVLALGDLKQGTVYEFFGSSGLSLTNWTDLTTDNFTINGMSLSDMGHVNLLLSMGGLFSYTIESLDLVWSGGESGSWDKNGSSESWVNTEGGAQSSFANYDNVSFNSSASLTIAENVVVNNLTVQQGAELTTEGGLTIQGDLSVAAGAKWTLAGSTEQSLTSAQLQNVSAMVIDADATLKVSDKLTSGYTKQNLSGTGKVELAMTQNWNNVVQLGAGFNGETYITSGDFDISGVQVGSTLRLADGVRANSAAGKAVLAANLVLEGETTVHANSTRSVTYSGSVTGQNGVYVSNGADSHIFNGEVNLKGFRVAHVSSSTYFNGKTTLETLNISTGSKTEFNGETNITTATFSGGTTLFNGVTTIGTANISTNMVFSSEMNIGTANISQNTTEFKAETSLNELKVTGGTVKVAGQTTIANGVSHIGGDIIFYADTDISGRVNSTGGNFRLLEGEVKLTYSGKDGNSILTLDASDGGSSKGTVRLGRDVKVSATNVYGTGNSKYILEQGASLTHQNKTVISNTGTGEATITSSASDGQVYGLGNGKFEVTNAHLKYTAGGNVTVNNKLTNTSVESAGGGTLTVSGTGNQLAGLYATGGNLKVEGQAGVSLGTISISTDRTITSTAIEVSSLARFEQGATLAADLTLLNGAKLDLTGEAVLNGALTLQTGLEMGDALLAMVSGMEVGDSVTLFSGVTGLTLQSGVTMFNMRSLEQQTAETLSSESFLSGTQANAADYFSNISSNSGLVISFSAVDGTVSISQSIPEPTTSTLGLLALAGLCARRRRK